MVDTTSVPRWLATGANFLIAGVLASILGCWSSDDRAFAVASHPVLRLAAEVEFAPSVSDADTPRKRLAQFRAAVESLPVPKDKKLRYLAIRLRKLVQTFEDWVDASEVVQASLASSEDPLYLDEARNERDASLKYAHELGILAAAERVALGSSDIRDHATEAFETTDTLPVSKRSDDSAYASQERFVRSQIAELR